MALIPAICILSGQPILDLNSAIYRGATVEIYNAETTTRRAAFRDYACTTQHAWPIKINAFGRIPQIYIDTGDYKVVLRAPDGTTIDTYDHLPGGAQSSSSTSTPSGFVTADLKPAYSAIPQDGWLLANGGTIGNGNSSATSRANDDTQNLFVALWNTDPNLVVTPSRGASATLDFQASKTLSLPDLRGRVLAGADKMGAQATAGRLTSATTSAPDQVGTAFGAEQLAISVAQLPTFVPTVSMAPAGAHTHSASTDVQGYHQHGGSTTASGDHVHPYVHSNISNAGGFNAGSGGNQGGYSDNTGAGGNHAHSIGTDAQGLHGHNVTVNSVADHIHTLTAASIGSGTPHANMQPTIIVYWHIRL